MPLNSPSSTRHPIHQEFLEILILHQCNPQFYLQEKFLSPSKELIFFSLAPFIFIPIISIINDTSSDSSSSNSS